MPFCERCTEHIEMWNLANSTVAGASAIALILGVVAFFLKSWALVGTAIGLFVLGAVLYFVFSNKALKMRGSACASARCAVAYQGWNGSVHDFEIANKGFAELFIGLNESKVIGASRDLASVVRVQKVVAAPRAERTTNRGVTDWIERIESLKGEVARRNALTDALRTVEGDDRDALIAAAADIEANAVLDKVSALKTDAAKRRAIESAVAKLRADNLPDSLQAAAIRRLEEELARI